MRINFKYLAAIVALLWSTTGQGQEFEKYFSDSTLRVDYILSGNVKSQSIAIDGMSRMPGWYGKRQNLTSYPVHGAATIDMRLASSGELIYSHTFSTLFQEWLDLDDAHMAPKAFECVELLPMPRDSVVITVNLYNHRQQVTSTIEHKVYPTDPTIVHKGEDKNVPKYVVLNEPARNDKVINIAFVAEGYTQEQMDDYLADCKKGVEGIFGYEPYKHLRDRFRSVDTE